MRLKERPDVGGLFQFPFAVQQFLEGDKLATAPLRVEHQRGELFHEGPGAAPGQASWLATAAR
jgi:hypothetical protein